MTWPWYEPTALLFLLAPAAGHLYHFILAINVTSGLGYAEHVLDRVRACLLALFLGSTGLLLWSHLRNPWWSWSGAVWLYAALCVTSGCLVFPLCSLTIRFRKRPAGITASSRLLDLTAAGPPHDLIGTGSDSWLLRLPGNESFQLWLRDWNISIADLPDPLDGLKIVQLTDLHLSPVFNRRYFERVIAACKSWDADLILVTGDVVEHEDAIPWIEPLLGNLTARLGKYAILGNHDQEHRPRDIITELQNAGFETLEGRWTSIEIEGSTVAIGGTSAPWGPEPDPRTIPPADFRLLLSHSPDLFYKAQRWGVDFMLSGHNHGGQIRLPLVGPVFMPSRYSRRFDRGFFRRQNLLLYVSEGVSGLHPIRYGCPPEVACFTLQTADHRPLSNSSRSRSTHKPHHPNLEADCV